MMKILKENGALSKTTYARHGGRKSTADCRLLSEVETIDVEDDERERTRSGWFASAVSSEYDENFAYRLKFAGNMDGSYRSYEYDANGNVTLEEDLYPERIDDDTAILIKPGSITLFDKDTGRDTGTKLKKVGSSDYDENRTYKTDGNVGRVKRIIVIGEE